MLKIQLHMKKKTIGAKNFALCILLTRPSKHILREFQHFTGSAPINHIVGLCVTYQLTLIIMSGQRDPELVTNSVPCKIYKSVDHCNRTYY